MRKSLLLIFVLTFDCLFPLAGFCLAQNDEEVKAWEDKITIPTYTWENDINPKFWALESGTMLSGRGDAAIVYPYVLQDHLSRTKVDRTYKALYLENEYLKIMCLPELGGRLHSVVDKTTGKEMFHLNSVIKPGMIAMRGAWISGGVEWNTGPHGHTVTILSPVNAVTGKTPDGSAYLEISNTEQIFRTRWTVRVTLHPGRSYLDEQIRIYNPTDGMHPYYFWNCTAFPNRPGTRFIFPMSLGTDHNAVEFFRWPVNEGRDLSWLKNYPTYSSIFAVNCTHDFFGAYDVDAGRGIVQAADHRQLGGKKAWTWGEWDFGHVAEKNLTDEDGPYIEVQSGPLPTQSDYGMLGPREQVSWQEYWYPVHGLGDGFEFANQNVAIQTKRADGKLELRILATSSFPQAKCILKWKTNEPASVIKKQIDLSATLPAIITVDAPTTDHVGITINDKEDKFLAFFSTPLDIPQVQIPSSNDLLQKDDDKLSVEELYFKGRKFDRATDRKKAREYYEKALARDPGHILSLRSLAILDYEAGLFLPAIKKLTKALARDNEDGLCWYYMGASRFRRNGFADALKCADRAAKCSGTTAIARDLMGLAEYRLGTKSAAIDDLEAFLVRHTKSSDNLSHIILAWYASGEAEEAQSLANQWAEDFPTCLIPRLILGLKDDASLAQMVRDVRSFTGDTDFEVLEASLTFADLGLFNEARKIVQAVCVDPVPKAERSFMPLYYLAWYSAQCKDDEAAHRWLAEAAAATKPFVFASRVEELDILQYAVKENPKDPQAHLQLGCLLANLGRVEEAVPEWQKAAELNPESSIAWRNLGLAAAAKDDLPKAEEFYRKAVKARPSDQTLYRDLAKLLKAEDRRAEAITLLETMPHEGVRRAEITMALANAYFEEKRYSDCIALFESTPYFVNWEGSDETWRLFNRSHIGRGCARLEKDDAKGALADFEAALTYPANLNVGRTNRPEEAQAQYWRGKALAALGRADDARAAWQAGANGDDGIKPLIDSPTPNLKSVQKQYRQKCIDALEDAKKTEAK